MSVLDCQGFGRQKADSGQDYITFFEKKRLEIYTLDELVEPIVRMLVKAAHAGHPGDGKIYIENVTEGIRISSGERGGDVA